jgi:uncharacterized protein YbaR (Trm112 family)
MAAIDRKLLDIICCPVSKVPLVPLTAKQLAALNKEISAGAALNVDAQVVSGLLNAGLLTTDGKIIYRIEDGIPVLLPEEGIATLQFQDFPRG